eukprot:14573869-Ditylum_brightwellii.AAC.1
MEEKAKVLESTQKVTETEISPLGSINAPDQIWRNQLIKDKMDCVASHNVKKQYGELIEYLTAP